MMSPATYRLTEGEAFESIKLKNTQGSMKSSKIQAESAYSEQRSDRRDRNIMMKELKHSQNKKIQKV
jgi:hypothetical protein